MVILDERSTKLEVLQVYFTIDKSGEKKLEWKFKDTTDIFYLIGVLELIKKELLMKIEANYNN